MRSLIQVALALLTGIVTGAAYAADFRSVSVNAAVLYDAPSRSAVPLFVLSSGYPVEVIVNLEAWVKVRDHTGALSWVERRALAERRTVLVIAGSADARQRPEETAPVAFRAQQFVTFNLVEVGAGGWIRVQHADGTSGFMRANQLWGL